MALQSISSGNPLVVNCNESLPVNLSSGQSQTFTFDVPRSPEPNGTWNSFLFSETFVSSKTDETTTISFNDLYPADPTPTPKPAPAPGTVISWTITQPNDGNNQVISDFHITLYPWNLPQLEAGEQNHFVCAGAATILAWNSLDAVSYTLVDGSGNAVAVTTDGGELEATVRPAISTTYTLTATGGGGETVSSTITLSVYPAPTVTLTATSPGVAVGDPIPVGKPITLTWTSANAEYVTITFADNFGNAYTCYTPYDQNNNSAGLFYPTSSGGSPDNLVVSGSMVAMQTGAANSLPPVIFSKAGTFTATAPSLHGCSNFGTATAAVTLLYPTDGSAAAATVSVTSRVSSSSGGGSAPLVLRRCCLSAPGSRYCRAEDKTAGSPPAPAGIAFWRANGPVPKLSGGTLWEAAAVPVTTRAEDTSPALVLDHRLLLYCAFARQGVGVMVSRSDDYGDHWGAEVAPGETEIMAIPGGNTACNRERRRVNADCCLDRLRRGGIRADDGL